MFSWMEDSLQQFDLEQTLQFNVPVRSLSKGFEDDGPFKVNLAACMVTASNVTLFHDTKGLGSCGNVMMVKESPASPIDSEELFGSPEPFTEGDEIDDDATLKWEDELSQLVESTDREVPLMDENTKEYLVGLPVKDFNNRTKALKLDDKVLQHLKLCRKRLKNRQAAIRSRSKKENETTFLQKRVDDLTREKQQQDSFIKQLQQRISELEKHMPKKS